MWRSLSVRPGWRQLVSQIRFVAEWWVAIEVTRFCDIRLYIPICDTENICEVFQLNTCYWLAHSSQRGLLKLRHISGGFLFFLGGCRGQS